MRRYGRLFPDPHHESVHRVISCDPDDTFVVDLDYVEPKDPDPLEGGSPVVQVGELTRAGPAGGWGQPRGAVGWVGWALVSGCVCAGGLAGGWEGWVGPDHLQGGPKWCRCRGDGDVNKCNKSSGAGSIVVSLSGGASTQP